LFDKNDVLNNLYFILQGKIDVIDFVTEESSKEALKTYSKKNYITASDCFSFKNNHNDFKAIADGKCEVLVISREKYNDIIKENEDKLKDAKINTISRNLLRFKKMDRTLKENNLKYFKSEKFSKGDVIVNLKSKIEELYLIEKGRVALVVPNDYNKKYARKFLVFAVLETDQIFNECPLILEKESAYHVVCIEDVQILSVDKANLTFVTDYETMQDLRANAQGKERLQKAYLDKISNLTSEQLEQNQKTMLQKLKVEYKFIDDIFNKSNTKGTSSNHYLKNLEKFNSVLGKVNPETKTASADVKLMVYCTPQMHSKDKNFNALDPQRQKAIFNLRMEGINRRSGTNTGSNGTKDMGKEEIAKLQAKLLTEEKNEVAKLTTKRTIGENLNLNSPHQEEEKNAKPDSFLRKMKQGNEQLLSKLQISPKSVLSPLTLEKPKSENKNDDAIKEPQEYPDEITIAEPKEKEQPVIKNQEEAMIFKLVDREQIDEIGLKMTKIALNKISSNFPTVAPKKKMNLFGNPGMI